MAALLGERWRRSPRSPLELLLLAALLGAILATEIVLVAAASVAIAASFTVVVARFGGGLVKLVAG